MLWDKLNEIVLYQYSSKFNNRNWFRVDFLNSRSECLLNVLLLNVTCNCYDLKLITISILMLFQQLSYSLRGFVSIHEGHATVGEDERVSERISFCDSCLDKVHCLFTIVALYYSFSKVLNS